mmetsp:Transcript_52608/g.112656  ORF Transcript_52608/g.112656 Transcript_52608/m.112656 type:complete len:204 (-) Transcript_52608:1582-2193(-)
MLGGQVLFDVDLVFFRGPEQLLDLRGHLPDTGGLGLGVGRRSGLGQRGQLGARLGHLLHRGCAATAAFFRRQGTCSDCGEALAAGAHSQPSLDPRRGLRLCGDRAPRRRPARAVNPHGRRHRRLGTRRAVAARELGLAPAPAPIPLAGLRRGLLVLVPPAPPRPARPRAASGAALEAAAPDAKPQHLLPSVERRALGVRHRRQ